MSINQPGGLGALLQSTDGLAQMAQTFAQVGGRELSSDAIACVMFLAENGSPDLVERLLAVKRYQLTTDDLGKFVDKLSPASHAKDMLAAQTAAAHELRS